MTAVLSATGRPAAATSLPAVELRNVAMDYGGSVLALEHIDLTLAEGEFVSIVGPSGCGKSTLLKLISGLEPAGAGEVLVRGRPVVETPAGIGFMFQRDALLPWANVRENIAVGLDCAGIAQGPAREKRLDELLALIGLTAFADAYPRTLSGGMRQRVALGRILAYAPDIYLMDEPFGALDAQTKLLLGQELLGIWSRFRKAILFVTHDIEEAVSLSDRVVVMTGRPGTIKSQYSIDLPRPRDSRQVRKLPAFHAYVDAIWCDIMDEEKKAGPQAG